MPRKALVAVLMAVLAGIGQASTRDLPVTGTTHGTPWRIEAAHPPADDEDVATSWCLRLTYEPVVISGGEEHPDVGVSCGRAPARRVSGTVDVECTGNAVFIYGGARRMVHDMTLDTRRGATTEARWAKLPPGSGFRGRTFVFVSDVRRFPARLLARGAGQRQIMRIPAKEGMCGPHGAGWAFADFKTRH